MSEPRDEDGALTQAAGLAALIFRETQWTWRGKADADYVPTASDVRACLERLLGNAREKEWGSSGTGRLLVQRDDLHGYSLLIRLANISIDEDGAA